MPKLYSGSNIVKTFKRAGFDLISQKGSHIKMKGFWGGKLNTVIIPNHKQVAIGTFQSILNQASMSKSEFEKFVK